MVLLRRIAKWELGVVVGVILTHAFMLLWSAWHHTPIANEMAHFAAGLSHLKLNRFELLSVNPPLVRSIAVSPVLIMQPKTDWQRYDRNPLSRSEHAVGRDLVNANGERVFTMLSVARTMCIPLCLLGAIVCFLWARSTYGQLSGILALALWCFCPFVLGHGPLMIADMHASALACGASFSFRCWILHPTWLKAAVAGVALGIAVLAKSTFLVLIPTWALIWLVANRLSDPQINRTERRRQVSMFLTLVVIGLCVINLAYGFEESFTPIESFNFHSLSLSGCPSWDEARNNGGNRFSNSLLGKMPVPLPGNFVRGLDKQRSDFEGLQPSFLAGRWQRGGWWYYYVVALAIKLPIGTITLIAIASYLTLFRQEANGARLDELILTFHIFAILLFVSSQTGFSHHVRYVIPVLPYAYIWSSKCARVFFVKQGRLLYVVGAALACTIASSLSSFPHCYSYFNEVIGGPSLGYKYLSESNVAWGQDLYYLRDWLKAHSIKGDIYFKDFAYFDPKILGISCREMPIDQSERLEIPQRFPSGWYVVNVCHLVRESHNYDYLSVLKPVAEVAYSYKIFYLEAQ